MPTLVIIAGPTACGKSSLSLKWAQQERGVIINADSQQLYRALPILTAQPDLQDQAIVPHYLYGLLSSNENASAPDWCRRVLPILTLCEAQSNTPFIVGGTGFYIKALTEGLSPIPIIPIEVAHEAEEMGLEKLWTKLQEVDPQLAHTLKPNDRYRIIRGWGTWKSTGKPLSYFQKLPKEKLLPLHWNVRIFFLNPPRSLLYERINKRFEQMWQQGAVEEVKALMKDEGFDKAPAFRALGADQIGSFLKGEITQEQAIEKACQLTRNYAKRQVTWFSHQLPKATLIDPQEASLDFLNFPLE